MSARNGVRARKNKERSKNFTELEKKTVLELISQHREVLRQGRSNNAANKSKQVIILIYIFNDIYLCVLNIKNEIACIFCKRFCITCTI